MILFLFGRNKSTEILISGPMLPWIVCFNNSYIFHLIENNNVIDDNTLVPTIVLGTL